MDQDGDIDLCGTSPDKNRIDWFENDGMLNFTQHTVTTSFFGANDVHPGDLDNDGDLDLVAEAYFANKIIWFENNGTQYFTEHVIRENFDGAHFSMFFDINKNGQKDVLGLSWEGDEIVWWEQTMIITSTTLSTPFTTTPKPTTTTLKTIPVRTTSTPPSKFSPGFTIISLLSIITFIVGVRRTQ